MDMAVSRTSVFLLFLLVGATFTLFYTQDTSAHPGRTDSSGGHTCRTNCESWGLEYGEYHYHNGGGSTSGGLSEAAQARIAGADFARTENRARIESSAKAEGSYQGNADGLVGKTTPYSENDSTEHCSQEIKYTTTPSATYKQAFQEVYTRTCTSVYDDAYRTAYQSANLSAINTYKANKEKELTAQKEASKENDNSWLGWAILGVFIGLPLIGAGWGWIKENF